MFFVVNLFLYLHNKCKDIDIYPVAAYVFGHKELLTLWKNTLSYEIYPMKRIKAVIFDCDGVMFDSRQANINYYNQILHRFNLPSMTKDQEDYIHMHTADESVKYIFRGSPFLEQAMAFRSLEKYHPYIKDMILEPGLTELLTSLKSAYGLAVATNRGDTIDEVLTSNGLKSFFDIVVSSLDVKQPKPHPESLNTILDFFKIIPEEALYIGDSLVDLQTAAAAQVPFTAYQNPGLNAPMHINNLNDVFSLLQTLNTGQGYP